MALFKILKGPEYETVNGQKVSRLPSTYHEGYCYFATDTHKFYIDISSENDPSSRVELNAYLSDYAVRAYYDEQGDSFLADYVKGGPNSTVRANEMVITTTKVVNSQNVPSITSRKLVDGYTIVESLPTGANADQNVVYLVADGEDSGSGGGSGGGGTVSITNTLGSGDLIATINGTNIYTKTVPTKVSDLTNDSEFLTLADLPVYDGSYEEPEEVSNE